MKNLRNSKDIYSKLIDEFLKKSFNIILNSRITKVNDKDAFRDSNVKF